MRPCLLVTVRVVLLKTASGVGVDVSLGTMDFEQRRIDHSSVWQIDGHRQNRTCSAEDPIVHKAFAGRGQDWVDISGMITQERSLDRDLSDEN